MYFYSTEVTKYNHDKPEQLEWFPELIIIERNDGTVFDFMKVLYCYFKCFNFPLGMLQYKRLSVY